MIEGIKKEIELYILKNHKDRYDELIDNIFGILDKYNNQPDYKSDIELFNLANKTLKDENENLNKGIDELLMKYEEEKELIWHDIMCNKKDTPTYNRLSGELTQVNQILEDLKKLKGE